MPYQLHSTEADAQTKEILPRELVLAFAPLHKRALGVAVGVATGLLIALLTLITLLYPPEYHRYLGLLSEYFYGYSISWQGALVGAFWGFVVGFVSGWFAAFCRNLAIATLLFITRTRSELAATRDFLDHI